MEAIFRLTLDELDIQFIEKLKSICSKDTHIEIKLSKDISPLSFETWNQQFNSKNEDMNEYISEYEMTLGDYRKKIYESEISKDNMTVDEFLDKLSGWNHKESKSVK